MSSPIAANLLLNVWTGFATFQPPDVWGLDIVHTDRRTFGGMIVTKTTYPSGASRMRMDRPDGSFTITFDDSSGRIVYSVEGRANKDASGNTTAETTAIHYSSFGTERETVRTNSVTSQIGKVVSQNMFTENADDGTQTSVTFEDYAASGPIRHTTITTDAAGNTQELDITIRIDQHDYVREEVQKRNGVVTGRNTERGPIP
ncbi:hypothetical protein [Mycolicibacterium sp. XJ870]